MPIQTIFILIAIAAAVLIFYSQRNKARERDKPQEREKAPDNIMDPNAWEIGPIMGGENYSKGLPLHPLPHPDGWCIDIPYPTPDAGHAHYITVPTGPLTGKTKVTLKLRLEMAPGVKLVPVKSPDAPSLLSLYFQRDGDNWTAEGPYEAYRWYASFATEQNLQARAYVLTATFADNWTAVQGSSHKTAPEAFDAALAEASRIGFVLGGGDGLGHGVYATGPARLVVTEFTVE